MDTILTVKNEHLKRLLPEPAVAFFRELAWAEASRIGVPFNEIGIKYLWIPAFAGMTA